MVNRWWFIGLQIPPQEPQQGLVSVQQANLVEHPLYISAYCDSMLSETQEDPKE